MTVPLHILAPRGRDAEVIAQVLAQSGVTSVTAPDLTGLLGQLDESGALLVTEECLYGPALPLFLDKLLQQPAWSDLPILVLATKQSGPRPPASAGLLGRLGNVLLLERPLNAETLAQAARSAVRARVRQLAVRDLHITLEHRVAERTEALSASAAQLRAMFDSFPEVLFLLSAEDGAFRVLDANPVAEAFTGQALTTMLGLSPTDFLPVSIARDMTAHLEDCLRTGQPVHDLVAIPLPQGTRHFEVNVTPIRDRSGRIGQLLSVARDVSARIELEAQLRQAQKLEAVGQLTGGVAHDFNNLLQVVMAGLTLMERSGDGERRRQLAESVRRAAQRGADLTKRLLTVARRQSLQPQAVALAAWFEDGAGDLLRRAVRDDISIDIDISPDLPPMEADPTELELALLNIAVNARDAMPNGGALRIRASAVVMRPGQDVDGLLGPFVRLAVTDTGAGMKPETMARVFEPFFTTKGIGQGTGLGLAQVYGFARQSGGSVRLESRLGHGTTVTLLLPVSTRPALAAPQTAPEVIAAQSCAVLVCEDDDDVAALVVDMLRQLGHSPTRVATAAAALGALADDRPVDILFTDVMMPGGMDGLALAREVRRRRPGLPVLLTTGYIGRGADEAPLGLPVLRKPYRIEDLAAALKAALA